MFESSGILNSMALHARCPSAVVLPVCPAIKSRMVEVSASWPEYDECTKTFTILGDCGDNFENYTD